MAETKNKDKKDDVVRETPDGDMVVRTVGRDFRVEGNNVDGYVGVSPEYRTYANDTEKPYTTDGDVEIFLASGTLTDVEVMTAQNAAASPRVESDDKADDDDKAEEKKADEDSKPGDSTSSAPAAPTQAAGGRQAAGTNTPNK